MSAPLVAEPLLVIQRRRRRLSGESVTGLAFVLPAVVLVGVIVLYPILEIVLMSFSDVNSIAQRGGFVGFANYQQFLDDPVFGLVVQQTLLWTVVVVGVATLISIPVALALNLQFRGRRFARALLIVPWAASLMINAIIWRWILDGQYSIINGTLMALGLIDEPIIWLGTEFINWFSLMTVGILVSIPFTSFSLLAGPAVDLARALRGGAGRGGRVRVHPATGDAAAAQAHPRRDDRPERHLRVQLVPDHLGDDRGRAGVSHRHPRDVPLQEGVPRGPVRDGVGDRRDRLPRAVRVHDRVHLADA